MEKKEAYELMTELDLTFDQVGALNDLCQKSPPKTAKESLDRNIQRILSLQPHSYVGPNTFFPSQNADDVEFRESPLLAAAKYGRLEPLQYFVSKFGHLIDLNRQGPCTLARNYNEDRVEEVLHSVTALNAACLGENPCLDVVKFLVSRGSQINLPNCRQSTPLMGVSYFGHLDIVKYLVKQGADVNAANLTGNTPLCTAVMGGHLKVVKYLIKKGANLNHRTVVGHTPLHIAVSEGHLSIVKELLSHGVPDGNNGVYDSSKPDFVPPPVLLAASEGSKEVVEFLLRRPCLVEVRIDALLLLGASIFEQRKESRRHDLAKYWGNALSLRERCTSSTSYLPPMEVYGNLVEVKTVGEFTNLFAQGPNFRAVYYQSLIMRERIMSYGDLGLVRRLSHSTMELIMLNRLEDAERQWIRLMGMMVYFVGNKPPEFTAHFFAHSFHPMWKEFLESFFEVFEKVIIPTQHYIDYRPFLDFVLKGIGFLELPTPSQACYKPSIENLVDHALYLFMLWQVQVENNESHKCDREDLDLLGRKFVSRYLCLPSGNRSLLHVCLSNQLIPRSHYCFKLPLLVSALLRWGAESAVDQPDHQGKRPLHYIVGLPPSCPAADVIRCLIDEGGAHLDTVDHAGKTPMMLDLTGCFDGYSSNPLSLSCQACHAIVREGIPYMEIGIPTRLKNAISIHDKGCPLPAGATC